MYSSFNPAVESLGVAKKGKIQSQLDDIECVMRDLDSAVQQLGQSLSFVSEVQPCKPSPIDGAYAPTPNLTWVLDQFSIRARQILTDVNSLKNNLLF